MQQRLSRRRFIEILGAPAATQLAARWAGRRIPRITTTDLKRIARDEAIRAEIDGGASYRSVARRYRLGLATVVNICQLGGAVRC